MQNTVAVGALVFLLGWIQATSSVLADTFSHKGKTVIDQNVGIQGRLRVRREHFVPFGSSGNLPASAGHT